MALTETITVPLGFEAPAFELPNVVTGRSETLEEHMGAHGTVVMFICNHCPFVVHVRNELVALARDYQAKGIGFVAISSNDIENYPQDAPEHMKALAEEMNFSFPYFFDESQEVAKAYDAACTPDFSVFDANKCCVYRGRLDDSTPGNNKPVTGNDLRACLNAMLNGNPIEQPQWPSMGCNIKWKS